MANEDASAVTTDAVQDTAATESAPVEEKQLEVVTEGPELNPNDFREETEDKAEDVADDTAEPEAVAETDKPQTDTKVDPKNEWDQLTGPAQERFRQKVNEANELRAQLAQLDARKAQVAQEQELLNEVNPETGDYYTPAEAERIARMYSLQQAQAQAEQEAQSLQLQQHQVTINAEAEQVVKDFPIFDPNSPDYNAEVAKSAAELLQSNLVLDEQGNIIGSNVSPYKLYQTVANAYQASAVANQIKGQKTTEKMLSVADNPTSAKPVRSSKDDADLSPAEYAKQHNLKTVW